MAFAALGERPRAWELLAMINPIHHARSAGEVSTYKVEPYVVAADVYALSPHTGRGGWTWYTGSAAWMYRLIVESLLGLKLNVDKLRFAPCLPVNGWETFKVLYRYRETAYHITVRQTHDVPGKISVEVDGLDQEDNAIPLIDDHQEHTVEVRISSAFT
jgi:cellobiose phosphorylase